MTLYQALDILTEDERRHIETTPETGFLVDFVKWAQRKTDAPTYSLQSAGLMALSLSCGDTVVLPDIFGSTVYMNLYILLVGPSTIMRKTTVLGFVMDLVPKNQQTQSHYIKALDDVSTQSVNKAAAEAGKAMSPIVLNMDEVAGVFDVAKQSGSYLKGLKEVLLKCYDHSPILISRTSGDIESPRGAFTNIFAASTPEPLMDALTSDDIASGLLPRFMVFDARDAIRGERVSLMERKRNKDEWKEEAETLRAFLLDVAQDRATGIPGSTDAEGVVDYPQTEIDFTDEAMERLDLIDARFSREAGTDETNWGAIKGRGFWHIYKMAGLYAVSRDGRSAVVELDDVLRAIHLIETTIGDLATMADEVGSNGTERAINEALAILDPLPTRTLEQTLIADRMKMTGRDFTELRSTMLMRGIIAVEKDEGGTLTWRKT